MLPISNTIQTQVQYMFHYIGDRLTFHSFCQIKIMSLQKPHCFNKFHSNLETHTKSKLINSLINKKLLQQKEFVRDRFTKIVQKGTLQQQEARPSWGSQFKVRKRAGSLKNINISVQNIKQSLLFNPVKQSLSQQAQFIISRQYTSPLLTPSQIESVVSARNNSHLIEIKLTETDKKGYQYIPPLEPISKEAQRIQDGERREMNWVKKIEQSLDNQLWLPSFPHTQILLQNMDEDNQLLKLPHSNSLNQILVVKSPTFTEHGNTFTPIKTSSQPKIAQNALLFQSERMISSKLLDLGKIQKQEIVYDFKKYNNNDFLALQKWFQKSISLAHQKYSQNQNQLQQKTSKLNLRGSVVSIKFQQSLSTLDKKKRLLNLLYSIHIGGFQQLIRLHYIEAWQKALVFEKMFWSLIRLFGCLMQEQHRINFVEYKGFQKQLKQQRELYEKRCSRLQQKMHMAEQHLSSTQSVIKHLALAYRTYSRVNHHICQQLQFMNKAHTQLQRQFDYLNHRMMRLISNLQMSNQLKTIADEETTTYYMIVDGSQRFEEIVTVKTGHQERMRIAENNLHKEVDLTLKKRFPHIHQATPKDRSLIQQEILSKRNIINKITVQIKQQAVFPTRVGERIGQMQHQLNKYWVDKQQSLGLDTMMEKQLLNYSTAEAATSTYQKYSTSQVGTQFPEHSSERSFGEFLKWELGQSINEKESKQEEDLCLSLKELYEESYQKIRQLERKNHSLAIQQQIKLKLIKQKDQAIAHLQQQLHSKLSDIQLKFQTIQELHTDKTALHQQLASLQISYDILQRKSYSDSQNSQHLSQNNLQLKEKLQKLTFKLKQAESKLALTIDLKQQIQIQLNHQQSLTKQYQLKYQHLHRKLQKLAPYVDKFLDFKRYDVESIIIDNLKKQLEQHFSEYFCKDSDLFLTKG